MIIFLPINLNICFGCSKETLLLSTHNICVGWEMRKIFCQYALLSRGLLTPVRMSSVLLVSLLWTFLMLPRRLSSSPFSFIQNSWSFLCLSIRSSIFCSRCLVFDSAVWIFINTKSAIKIKLILFERRELENHYFLMACSSIWFVLFDSLRPSQQFFSYVGMDLPGLNQY